MVLAWMMTTAVASALTAGGILPFAALSRPGQQLLEHVAVPLQEHAEELARVVGHEIQVEPRLGPQPFLGLVRIAKTEELARRLRSWYPCAGPNCP